jgi:hypothetical protein
MCLYHIDNSLEEEDSHTALLAVDNVQLQLELFHPLYQSVYSEAGFLFPEALQETVAIH